MRIEVSSLTEEASAEIEYGSALRISIDGKQEFFAMDGEPEDATLSRNFNDCWKIPELLKMVHEAGLRGEELEILNQKGDLEDL